MVTITPLPQLAELEYIWRAVISSASHSFFLSWPWIRTWLACLPVRFHPQLLTISEGGCLIAAAILVRRRLRRRGVLPTDTWILNATGDPELDQVFIEYNDLLVQPDHASVAWQACADYFKRDINGWDEIQLRGIRPSMLEVWKDSDLRFCEEMTLTTRYVDLNEVRATSAPFVSGMAKKRRARIRQTQDIYEKLGPLQFEVAQDKQQAAEFFAELKLLHQDRWETRNVRGAFDYPFFHKFHAELIDKHFDDGVIQLMRLRAGTVTIGVLYNFVHNGDVAVYQTGFNYSQVRSPNKESPGLLTHVMAIEHNRMLGYNRYDLLAGDSEYKQALAHHSERLWWGRVQRRRLKFSVENGLRHAWHHVHDRIGTMPTRP